MISKSAFAAALALGLTGTIVTAGLASDDPQPAAPTGSLVVASDGTGDYSTIAGAIEAAEDGDTVLVGPGTYDEAIVVTKDIALVGNGPRAAIVLTTEDGPILQLVDSDAAVTGLTFSGPSSDGVIVEGGSPRLEGLLFHSVGASWPPGFSCDVPCDSLTIRGDSTATVQASTFATGGGIRVEGAAPLIRGNELVDGPALMLQDVGDGTVVRDNSISGALGNAISIYLGDARPSIEGNVVVDAGASGISIGYGPGTESSGVGAGLWPVSEVDPIVRGNTVSGATNGITVTSGAMPLIEDNLLVSNGTAIVVSNADPTISGNDVRDNGVGVFVMWGAPRLEGNSITGGLVGLGIGTSGARPTLEGNRIVANAADVDLMFGGAMPAVTGNEIGPFVIGQVSR